MAATTRIGIIGDFNEETEKRVKPITREVLPFETDNYSAG
jgi:hypothetical protein